MSFSITHATLFDYESLFIHVESDKRKQGKEKQSLQVVNSLIWLDLDATLLIDSLVLMRVRYIRRNVTIRRSFELIMYELPATSIWLLLFWVKNIDIDIVQRYSSGGEGFVLLGLGKFLLHDALESSRVEVGGGRNLFRVL